MKMRLHKILSARGVASRRAAERLIAEGRVTVNGRVAVIGELADMTADKIIVNGKELPPEAEHVYILLNKPRGYISTMSDERGRKTVAQLVADCPVRVYPVGRLDMDSEGLLIMTNDGELANRLMHPSFEVRKTYIVKVRGDTDSAVPRLSEPFELDGKKVQAQSVLLLEDGALSITITDGRNRQVRRMCEEAGLEVTRLKRISEGGLTLGNLRSGKWRYLTSREEKMLHRRHGDE